MNRRDYIAKLSIGDKVEVQSRLKDDSPVLTTGVVVDRFGKDHDLVVVRMDDDTYLDCSFNPFGICMPFNRQLQIKWK